MVGQPNFLKGCNGTSWYKNHNTYLKGATWSILESNHIVLVNFWGTFPYISIFSGETDSKAPEVSIFFMLLFKKSRGLHWFGPPDSRRPGNEWWLWENKASLMMNTSIFNRNVTILFCRKSHHVFMMTFGDILR